MPKKIDGQTICAEHPQYARDYWKEAKILACASLYLPQQDGTPYGRSKGLLTCAEQLGYYDLEIGNTPTPNSAATVLSWASKIWPEYSNWQLVRLHWAGNAWPGGEHPNPTPDRLITRVRRYTLARRVGGNGWQVPGGAVLAIGQRWLEVDKGLLVLHKRAATARRINRTALSNDYQVLALDVHEPYDGTSAWCYIRLASESVASNEKEI